MNFAEHLLRTDLPALTHARVKRTHSIMGQLLAGYVRVFGQRLGPLKPVALVNGMPVYNVTQPPMYSEAGQRVLQTGFDYVVLKRPARPINMVLAVTPACDMECRHCSARGYMKSGKKALSLDEIKSVLDQFVAMNGASVVLSGGEPTLHPHLLDIVSHVDPAKAVVSMFTNGARLKEHARDLKAAGLFGTLVSLDSDRADLHDAWRGLPGAFDRAVAAIETLRDEGMLVGISSYISRPGLETGDFTRMVDLGTRLGVHELFLFDTVPTGALLHEKDLILTPEDRARVRELAKEQNGSTRGPGVMSQSWVNSREGFGCFAGFYQVYVSCSGDVAPCDFTPVTFGNVRDEPLQVIWDRIRASPDWGVRHPECRMQDCGFRASTLELLPPDAALPVPYEQVVQLRAKRQAPH
jgi:MoaA/NifB/PqqE/SkfB family radical SAM enzyme